MSWTSSAPYSAAVSRSSCCPSRTPRPHPNRHLTSTLPPWARPTRPRLAHAPGDRCRRGELRVLPDLAASRESPRSALLQQLRSYGLVLPPQGRGGTTRPLAASGVQLGQSGPAIGGSPGPASRGNAPLAALDSP